MVVQSQFRRLWSFKEGWFRDLLPKQRVDEGFFIQRTVATPGASFLQSYYTFLNMHDKLSFPDEQDRGYFIVRVIIFLSGARYPKVDWALADITKLTYLTFSKSLPWFLAALSGKNSTKMFAKAKSWIDGLGSQLFSFLYFFTVLHLIPGVPIWLFSHIFVKSKLAGLHSISAARMQ